MDTLRSKVSVGEQGAGFSVFARAKLRLSVCLWSPTPRNSFIRRLANGLLQTRAISEMRHARLWDHKPLKTSPHRKSFMNEKKKDRTWPRACIHSWSQLTLVYRVTTALCSCKTSPAFPHPSTNYLWKFLHSSEIKSGRVKMTFVLSRCNTLPSGPLKNCWGLEDVLLIHSTVPWFLTPSCTQHTVSHSSEWQKDCQKLRW